MRRRARIGACSIGMVLGASAVSHALFLDEAKLFRLTGTFYTQARLRLEDSKGPIGKQIQPFQSGGTPVNTQAGNLVQWRNLAAPVFEGTLGRAIGLTLLDDLSFRFAGRFTYDGVFDYGPQEFRQDVRLRHRSSKLDPLGGNQPVPVWQGTKYAESDGVSTPAQAAQRAARLADQELFDARETFGRQMEAWEIYLNVQKGRLFSRIGRQNLSWGETDGLRLLDVINPIDNFFGLTFDEDLDEKRIPLWMIRVNYQLIDFFGPISSLGLETFVVPGVIDTTQGPVPFQGSMHPYAPPAGCDAQLIADNSFGQLVVGDSNVPAGCNNIDFLGLGNPAGGTQRVSFYERLPRKTFENSRYGARVVGVLLNRYTMSLAAYRTWSDIPQPLVHYYNPLVNLPFNPQTPELGGLVVPNEVLIELTHGTVTIFGGTISFYQNFLLPGVVRGEIGYFMDEPAYVPMANIGDPFSGQVKTFVPTADYLRWVIGFDVFELNVPWLSRTNNIIVVTQWFNQLLLNDVRPLAREVEWANTGLVSRNIPEVLPDRPAPNPLYDEWGQYGLTANPGRAGRVIIPAVGGRYNATWSVALQAFLMHGNLIPQIVGVAFSEGDFGFLPSFIYRFNDNFQMKVGYAGIYGKFSQLGLFRDRDQVGIRLSYLLN